MSRPSTNTKTTKEYERIKEIIEECNETLALMKSSLPFELEIELLDLLRQMNNEIIELREKLEAVKLAIE